MFRLSYQKMYPLLNGHIPIFSQDFNTLEEVNAYKIRYVEFMKDSFNITIVKL